MFKYDIIHHDFVTARKLMLLDSYDVEKNDMKFLFTVLKRKYKEQRDYTQHARFQSVFDDTHVYQLIAHRFTFLWWYLIPYVVCIGCLDTIRDETEHALDRYIQNRRDAGRSLQPWYSLRKWMFK